MKASSSAKKATTKKVVKEQLAEEKKYMKQFENLLLQTPVAIAIFRGNNYVVELANNMALGLMVKDKSCIDKSLFQAMPELENQLKPIFDKIMQTGIPFQANEIELTLYRNHQTEKGWFNVNYQPILDDDNTISGILASANELTEQVVSRKKLEESDKRYKLMLMKSPFGFAVLKGKNMVITFANDSVKEIWGKGKDLEGKPLLEVLPEIKNSEFPGLLDKVYTTGVPFYGEELLASVFRNGKLEDVYFNFVYQPYLEADETISGVTIIAYEVTAQALVKKAIAEQREAERKALNLVEETNKRYYSMLMESPFAFSVMKGKDMVITLANDLIKEFWGKGKDVEGKKLLELLPEIKNQAFPEMIDKVYTTGIPVYANEILGKVTYNDQLKHKYFNVAFQPYYEADNSISGVIQIAYEVTEMIIARKKIEESEHRYHEMIYSSKSLISICKGENMIIEIANDAMLQSWGKGNIIGKSVFEAIPESIEQGFDKLLLSVYNTGQPVHAFEAPVTLLRNGIKEVVYYNFIYQAQRNKKGEIEGVAVIANEVTPEALSNIKLKESEERFRLLADNMPLHIFIIEPNAEATVCYWNKNWLDYTGQTLEEALGNTWPGVIHPDDVQPIMEVYVPAFENQQPYFLPAIRVRRYDGEYRWHSVQANPRYLPNGNYMGYIGVGFDIHEQKLAQDALKLSEEHFRLMGDLMPAKISNASADGSVTYFNIHWLTFSGYTFEELKDFGYHKMMHPDEMEEFQQRLQKAAETGTDSVMEMRFKNKEGHYKWHLNIASPIKDKNGVLKMWIGVTTEMQHQKEQREELEQAVAERTIELSAANEELKKMNKELEAFTYVSSHDLQEPLRKIQTFAGRILEKENDNLSDSGKNYFHIMRNSAERMQTLIQDLLAFSHLSLADRKFETTHLNSIIEEVKKEFKEAIAETHATIEVKGVCAVKIIPFQFRQLMHNLIGNALKFSNPSIPPHIIIKSQNIHFSKLNIANLPPQKEYCHITITDNGIGFEKEFAEKIFEVFQKLHGKDEYAGTGIGLAIVKKIIENHNGIITATSELNKGTTFDIYIPT